MRAKAGAAAVFAASLSLASMAAAQTAATPDYVKAVFGQVAKATVYPKMAKLRGQQGKVGCILKIDAKGAVMDESVETSSGVPALDDAALDAIKNAAPFQPPPGGTDAGTTVHLLLNFSLDG